MKACNSLKVLSVPEKLKRMQKLVFITAAFLLISCSPKESELQIASIFGDNMVLQQDTNAPVWGTAVPGTKIKLVTSWGAREKVRTGKDGRWVADLTTPKAGGIHTMLITAGADTISMGNIVFGEVWLCSGQSNMEMPVKGWLPNDPIDNSENEVQEANYPEIRMFTVQKAMSYTPEESCTGSWKVCTPDNVPDFSATAYFYGRELHKNLEVPVGLIHSSWGGTPAEAWTQMDHLGNVPGYETAKEKLLEAADKSSDYNAWLESLKTVDINPESANPADGIDFNDAIMSSSSLDDSDWNSIPVPAFFEESLGYFDGVIWFRKEFDFSGNPQDKNYSLFLGTIDDMDVSYINGTRVGGYEKDGYWQQDRLYKVPPGLLKKGKNVVAVRVTDSRGSGGIYGNRPVGLMKGNEMVIDMSGDWKFLPVAMIAGNSVYLFEEGSKSFANMPAAQLQLTPFSPSVLYNAMIAPLVPYAIKGAIWYQGESNVGRGKQYQILFPSMIQSWRDQWGTGNFPFYYVQIAPFNYNESVKGITAELREAQLLALQEENVGMVVTTDIGNPVNIHPGNKQEVGRRLALWARAKTYGQENLVFSGPLFKSMEVADGEAILSFDYTGSGLYSPEPELSDFEIAGDNKMFYPAHAVISGDKVVVSSESVAKPVYVRFGWSDTAEPDFFNKEGLPASPFRTSEW